MLEPIFDTAAQAIKKEFPVRLAPHVNEQPLLGEKRCPGEIYHSWGCTSPTVFCASHSIYMSQAVLRNYPNRKSHSLGETPHFHLSEPLHSKIRSIYCITLQNRLIKITLLFLLHLRYRMMWHVALQARWLDVSVSSRWRCVSLWLAVGRLTEKSCLARSTAIERVSTHCMLIVTYKRVYCICLYNVHIIIQIYIIIWSYTEQLHCLLDASKRTSSTAKLPSFWLLSVPCQSSTAPAGNSKNDHWSLICLTPAVMKNTVRISILSCTTFFANFS